VHHASCYTNTTLFCGLLWLHSELDRKYSNADATAGIPLGGSCSKWVLRKRITSVHYYEVLPALETRQLWHILDHCSGWTEFVTTVSKIVVTRSRPTKVMKPSEGARSYTSITMTIPHHTFDSACNYGIWSILGRSKHIWWTKVCFRVAAVLCAYVLTSGECWWFAMFGLQLYKVELQRTCFSLYRNHVLKRST
jgi:hypothetical protein